MSATSGEPVRSKRRPSRARSPAPNTEFGVNGLGEGGANPPPAVIGNAVNVATGKLGAEVSETPISPRRVLAAITRARETEEVR